MRNIQEQVLNSNANIRKIVDKALDDMIEARCLGEEMEKIKFAAKHKILVEMARAEGYITGKISAAQKEPESIKL